MWIIFGTGVKTTRIPGGARAERRCDRCDEDATFYEKEVTATFRLYFIDVFDYRRHRVMSCGCCGACYATDELGVPGEASTSIGEEVGRAASRVGGYLERAAGAMEAGISSLFTDESTKRHREEVAARANGEREEQRAGEEQQQREDDDPLADPVEARFRKLERKPGVRIKID